MKYDFDEIIPRRGTNSVKWDLATDERVLPMWVADMDFRTAPPVLDALERRLRHGVFRLYEGPRRLFRSRKRVVRQTARIPHRKRVDPPDYGRHSRPFGHPEGPDRTGRQGNPSDARLQLFLSPYWSVPAVSRSPIRSSTKAAPTAWTSKIWSARRRTRRPS